jgi:Double zinc ribbon
MVLRHSVGGVRTRCGSIGCMRQQQDWYAYLNLATDATTEQIEQAVERLSRQATALAVTAPERSQRLRDTVRSIKGDLLSGPEAKARYDAGRGAASAPPSPPVTPPAVPPLPSATSSEPSPAAVPMSPETDATGGAWPLAAVPAGAGTWSAGGEGIGSRIARFLRTGWTCANCGKEALPSDKFCTRCGTTITPTRHDATPQVTRVACVNCTAALGINDAFCARCGARVAKLTVTL